MKPLKPATKLKDVRVTRKSVIELKHSGDGHGWAVSYADMLMVLLSFFVLFFSLESDPEIAKSQLQVIAMNMKGESVPEEKLLSSMAQPAQNARQIASIAESLKIDGMKTEAEKDRLLVYLENSTYRPGQYSISKELRKQILEFKERIAPYQDKISVTVIGHTDDKPLLYRNELLKDNFDLSSLRALTVLKFMISEGFPQHKGSARAASSFDRNSRSITFEIQIKEDKKGSES